MRFRLCGLLVAALTQAPVCAQCSPEWSDQFGPVAIQGSVMASAVFDPDGPGPEEPIVVAGGDFTNGVFGVRDTTRLSFGQDFNGPVHALLVFDEDGPGPGAPALFAGGSFTQSGPNPMLRVARWTGSAWLPMGAGRDNTVLALAAFDADGAGPNPASVYAAGLFAGRIARWTGTIWTGVGLGVSGTSVNALCVFDPDAAGPLGDVLAVGGQFTGAGGHTLPNFALWSGAVWSGLGAGFNAPVHALATHDPDAAGPLPRQLVAGGEFTASGAIPLGRIARFASGAWTPLGSGLDGSVRAIRAFDDDGPGPAPDSLFAAGSFQNAGAAPASRIARWNGAAWSALGVGANAEVRTMCVHADNNPGLAPAADALYVGGAFTSAGPLAVGGLVKWMGAQWKALTSGNSLGQFVFVLHPFDRDGPGPLPPELYAGGGITILGGVAATGFAAWDGAQWRDAGQKTSGGVRAMVDHDPDGPGPQPPVLHVGGSFAAIGGIAASNVASVQGGAWTAYGDGFDGTVLTLERYDLDGPGPAPADLYAGGQFANTGPAPVSRIARWTGAAWAPLDSGVGVGVAWSSVEAFAVFDDDGPGPQQAKLFVGGRFAQAGPLAAENIASWNGAAWLPVGIGLPHASFDTQVRALAVYDEDDAGPAPPYLYAAGRFGNLIGTPIDMARWNGVTWLPVGTQSPGNGIQLRVFDADEPGGGFPVLLASGGFGADALAAWDGVTWTGLGIGAQSAPFALAAFDDTGGKLPRALYVGGSFTQAGGLPAGSVSRWGCPPPPACYPDCNADSLLTVADFGCFQTRFVAGDPYADCNGDGVRTVADFGCFQTLFVAGCP